LHFFSGGTNDGAHPLAAPVQGSDGNFYGTTRDGGTYGGGTVFKITTNGAYTSLYSFSGTNDGALPYGGLVQGSDGNFYGTTPGGGTNGAIHWGTVFKISTNGALITLFSFDWFDGASPYAGLVQGRDGSFYGTTSEGNTIGGYGTVFKISTNGALTSLYSFRGTNDGALPSGGLVQGSDGNFYGTTERGGTNDFGTVFKISTNGAYNRLYSFTGGNDGGGPNGLVQGSDGNFYGTTERGGANNSGTVFKMTSSGALTILYSFTGGNGGANPWAGLVRAGLVQGIDGSFYGTTYSGGQGSAGTVFRLTVVPDSPQLTITPTGANVILAWPTNSTGYTLESTTNLVSPAWTTNSLAPVVVNGQNTVTNPISGTQQFFRLSH
jgi:uncharacterized repeat protein (TIGR03803 family)